VVLPEESKGLLQEGERLILFQRHDKDTGKAQTLSIIHYRSLLNITSHGLGSGYESDDNAAGKVHTRKGSPTGSKRGPAMLRRYRGRDLKSSLCRCICVASLLCQERHLTTSLHLLCLNVVCAAGALPPEVQAFVTETNTPVGQSIHSSIFKNINNIHVYKYIG
jgi:hypothetical protein